MDAPPKTVLIIGDSGTYDMSPAFTAGFKALGTRVVSTAFPSLGLTRPGFVRDLWTQAITNERPDLVVVGIGMWDDEFIAKHGWTDYAAVVDSTISLLTSEGARVMWLSVLPSDNPRPDDRERAELQDRIFSALPARHPGVVDYVNITPALAMADGTTPRVVDGRLLRKPDGWHLCPDGAAAVAHAVLGHLGMDSDQWEHGRWQYDPRYNDPRGGCPA
jgi:hypothetical protein